MFHAAKDSERIFLLREFISLRIYFDFKKYFGEYNNPYISQFKISTEENLSSSTKKSFIFNSRTIYFAGLLK